MGPFSFAPRQTATGPGSFPEHRGRWPEPDEGPCLRHRSPRRTPPSHLLSPTVNSPGIGIEQENLMRRPCADAEEVIDDIIKGDHATLGLREPRLSSESGKSDATARSAPDVNSGDILHLVSFDGHGSSGKRDEQSKARGASLQLTHTHSRRSTSICIYYN